MTIIDLNLRGRGRVVRTSLAACAIGIALACSACVSMGANYDPAIISSIQPGTSQADVIAKLGKPTSITTLADGTRQLMWIHSTGNALGQGSARSAMLLFDSDGKFVRVMSTNQTNIR